MAESSAPNITVMPVTYTDEHIGNHVYVSLCQICFAAVPRWTQDRHADWHRGVIPSVQSPVPATPEEG